MRPSDWKAARRGWIGVGILVLLAAAAPARSQDGSPIGLAFEAESAVSWAMVCRICPRRLPCVTRWVTGRQGRHLYLAEEPAALAWCDYLVTPNGSVALTFKKPAIACPCPRSDGSFATRSCRPERKDTSRLGPSQAQGRGAPKRHRRVSGALSIICAPAGSSAGNAPGRFHPRGPRPAEASWSPRQASGAARWREPDRWRPA